MKVIDLARATGVSADTIRYYTRIGLLTPHKDPENGYKRFNRNHIKIIHFVKRARDLGFSLKEIQQLIQDSEEGISPCPAARNILREKIEVVRAQLLEMQALFDRMEEALEEWGAMPDGIPNGDAVCHLIEHWGDRMQSCGCEEVES